VAVAQHERIDADLTGWLSAWHGGDRVAAEQLFARVYGELRRMAAGLLSGSAPARTLQPTALVNEAMIKLIGADAGFESRAHFFGAAARAMRQVLVDHARRHHADKRGGGQTLEALEAAAGIAVDDSAELVALDEALSRLEQLDPQAARVVELRYFAGLSIDETAIVLGQHPSTTYREWQHAKAWLKLELSA
jgi:RNA polymerase sigma factor (TIGR02999 family)